MTTILDSIITFNKSFVENKEYEQYQTTKFPNKKLVILTCMDTRLVELLHRSMDLKNGDAKIIRNAGAVISHPFGSIMRSILVALYQLQAEEILIIGHHGCGMTGLEHETLLEKAKARGVDLDVIEPLEYAGVDVKQFLSGFSSVEENILNSVDLVKKHPLLPNNVPVHGLIISPETGELDVLVNGYTEETNV
ncbi:beta-class carbonic anhydrase [Alkalihalobacillus pseudalcaliphilus]|uniref:beta-class carbonic anhydrase n=1 Tax=Alkalihalobacillus pseudalcaliphilus TaxID=79884 RepID=UPI00064E0087|nr:carbonic anhydrase [Alkalihalobacillus pseudalcaliphilus]KMK77782.1 carbonic anhydrase [Alkalihalobacillus pseudalcaliphilus]